MNLKIYQVDAFSQQVFSGNPAAICPLEEWLPDNILQAIAAENNLSETAFFVAEEDAYHLRWFTPVAEVDLCGHATLASAYVLFNLLNIKSEQIRFSTRSGILTVARNASGLQMDFPSQQAIPCEAPSTLIDGLGITPLACWVGEDYVVQLRNEAAVKQVNPDFSHLKQLDKRGVIITSESQQYDFVSRFFAPKYGIDEDPVTGSAHTLLAPIWAKKLQKTLLSAKQISQRGGELTCEFTGDRVLLSGQCAHYLTGEINLPSFKQ